MEYASYQNHLNRKKKIALTNEDDWCKDCGKFIPTVWTSGNFPMPIKKCACKSSINLAP